jgi:phosphoadenosine phosphosulfate reductase
MPLDPVFLGLSDKVARLNDRYRYHAAVSVLEHALGDPDVGRTALVSSFGAESVVLLHMIAVIDRTTPVLFIDTRMLFGETLAYQADVADRLGLTNIVTVRADQKQLAFEDPDNTLHQFNTDACCAIRKT